MLAAQIVAREPASLVSAFDFSLSDGLKELANEFHSDQTTLFLDSGGYESQRYRRYQRQNESDWSDVDFREARTFSRFDLSFSFDYYPDDSESFDSYADRLISSVEQDPLSGLGKIAPVAHLVTKNGGRQPLGDPSRLLEALAARKFSNVIAVPERELGLGLRERARKTKVLATAAHHHGCYLHILGCGNPLSISVLVAAGADIVDGLEWCRTAIDTCTFHLFHPQHLDVINTPPQTGDPTFEYIVDNLNYSTRLLVNNLLGFRAFGESLTRALDSDNVEGFVMDKFGARAAELIKCP
jgi:hypothetical protein